MCIGYSFGTLFYTVLRVWKQGMVDDFMYIIFWSGLFELLGWSVFVLPVLKRIDHSRKLFKRWIFPIISLVYSQLVFLILIGWLFLSSHTIIIFCIAGIVGFSFGLSYVFLIKNTQVVGFFSVKILNRLIVLLYPVLFLFSFLYVFPKLSPGMSFRYMPIEVRDKIIMETLPKFKIGDNFTLLNNSLPGLFNDFYNGSGNMSSSFDGYSFMIQVNCNRIIRFSYGDSKTTDITIYGNLRGDTCR